MIGGSLSRLHFASALSVAEAQDLRHGIRDSGGRMDQIPNASGEDLSTQALEFTRARANVATPDTACHEWKNDLAVSL
jgi:hypothetical protein